MSQIISAGSLRNATAGQMRFAAGAGGPRSFTGQLLNTGMVTVDPGMLLTVVGPTFDNLEGGLVTGQGSYDVTFTHSPRPGAPLFDSFTYVVRDSAGAETPGQVTIVEAGVDGQPSRNISGISVPPGGPAMVRGHGIPGRTYRIDVKNQLSDPDWQPLGSIQAGPDGTWNLPDEAASAHETRFYRTVEL